MSVGILSAGIVLDDDFVVTLETMDVTSGINNAAQGSYSLCIIIHVNDLCCADYLFL